MNYNTFLYIKIIGTNFRVSCRQNGKALLELIRKEHPITCITTYLTRLTQGDYPLSDHTLSAGARNVRIRAYLCMLETIQVQIENKKNKK